eukprot:TRINITY_DN61434_c0_g1_i1.p1 TRINITY_DN61434_c0_g1~~TRINITY_DN61434_c0_g1_i1.p1  ORF type:complete len:754 (+),score=186.52 TRINITY_DN61434_c0_g1_i1:198-2264(+)
METVLGEMRMDIHKMVHAYHETSLKFLVRKEQNWRRAEEEIKELKETIAHSPKMDSEAGSKHSRKEQSLWAQVQKQKAACVEKDKAFRQSQAENFELREQLAAMQAVGAGFPKLLSSTAGDMDRVPYHEHLQPWPLPPPSPSPVSKQNTLQSSGRQSPHFTSKQNTAQSPSVCSFMAKLDTAEGDPLDRLERAQQKLDSWASFQNRKPDPVQAGLVDFNTMEIPAIPGTLDEKSMLDEDGAQAILDKKHDAEQQEAEKDEDDDDLDVAYTRQIKGKKKKEKKAKGLNMKDAAGEMMSTTSYDVRDYYKTTGLMQVIARSSWFETVGLVLISLNALWIGVDMSFNDADILINAPLPFIIIENLFCIFFTTEIAIRFGAFQRKIDACKDRWFVFDLSLVSFMVFETWVMFSLMALASVSSESLFDSSVLRVLKLLRISRAARLVRLLRGMPEIVILLKGIGVASRSVFWTVLILISVVYIFAIAFTQLSDETVLGERYFPTLVEGMFTLLFNGCFFDGLPDLAKACFKEHLGFGLMLCLFILICPLTVMNMLVGVLVEVVGIVAAAEQESMNFKLVTDQIRVALMELDENRDDMISKEEFAKLLQMPDVIGTFNETSIDAIALVRDPDIVFAGDNEISVKEFLDEVLTLRGTNTATVKDIVQLKKQLLKELKGTLRKHGRVTGRSSSKNH